MYVIPKPSKTNQDSCLRLRPVVNSLQLVRKGEVLAECQSSDNGEMSLGANLSVAFMCWDGFNYEDSILISKRIIEEGILDSIHIMELEIKVNRTQFGNDLLTNEIKQIPFIHRKCLLENGIIELGSMVFKGDVLVGKLSPIFDVNDNNIFASFNSENKQSVITSEHIKSKMLNTSCYVPEGVHCASVLEINRMSLKDNVNNIIDGSYERYILGFNIATKTYIKKCCKLIKHGMIIKTNLGFKFVPTVLLDKEIENMLSLFDKHYISCLMKIQKDLLNAFLARLDDDNNNNNNNNNNNINNNNISNYNADMNNANTYQVLEVIKIKLLIRRSIQTGDKLCGRHGNKGVISKIVPKQDMPFMADGTIVDIVLNPLGVPSRMNLGQILEASLGLISYRFRMEFKQVLQLYEHSKDKAHALKMLYAKIYEIYPNAIALSSDGVLRLAYELVNGIGISCSLFNASMNELIKKFSKRLSFPDISGQFQLYNGKTGLPFDRKSAVGIIYVFKLNHLIDDKMHARSTGPYSVITQQPLKGKAYKGGQRLGEMEIWALQGYGVAYTIKEIISAKCDDIISRDILHDSILNNTPLLILTWGESLLLLIKELFAMCLEIVFK